MNAIAALEVGQITRFDTDRKSDRQTDKQKETDRETDIVTKVKACENKSDGGQMYFFYFRHGRSFYFHYYTKNVIFLCYQWE